MAWFSKDFCFISARTRHLPWTWSVGRKQWIPRWDLKLICFCWGSSRTRLMTALARKNPWTGESFLHNRIKTWGRLAACAARSFVYNQGEQSTLVLHLLRKQVSVLRGDQDLKTEFSPAQLSVCPWPLMNSAEVYGFVNLIPAFCTWRS